MKPPAFKPLKRLPHGPGATQVGPFQLADFPGFSAEDLKSLERFYSSQLSRYQSPEQRVGWQTPESQQVRFDALSSIGPLEGCKVLDLGCGLGAFWGYLQKKGLSLDYTGVDLFPNVIREARQLYPEAHFEARVILAHPFPVRTFDYSFLSGVFNVRVRDNWKYMRELLASVLRQTKKAVAFNILNAEAGLREPDRFMVRGRDLVAFGRKLGVSRVHLLDHYHPLDLTLFLYK